MTIDNTMKHCIPRKINKSYKLKMDQLTRREKRLDMQMRRFFTPLVPFISFSYANLRFLFGDLLNSSDTRRPCASSAKLPTSSHSRSDQQFG